MEIGTKLVDLSSYNENMAKGMEDKLFFVEKLNLKKNGHYLFVDFGCADGALIDTLYGIMESNEIHCYFIGYDISETMIELAKTKFNYNTTSVLFTSDWDEVKNKVDTYSAMESILILSSVIHEVYSYAESEDDINLFWHRVLESNFKYICVRDMMCSMDIERPMEDYHKFKENIPFATSMSIILNSFEKKWGKIYKSNKQFVHFLLKYRWRINWNREVNENYFPIFIEDFIEKIKSYNLIYFERFKVPFLEECWKQDFNVEIDDYTHVKAIFSKSKI